MKRVKHAMAIAALSGIAMVATADLVTNIDTVTTTAGNEYSSPYLLAEMTVTCTDTAGSEPVQKTFAALAAEGFGDCAILRKCGDGWMQSSVKMASFKGEIHIEGGGFIVNTNLMTGAQDYDTAPVVHVSSGATFMLRATDSTCAKNSLTLYNEFYLAGEGYNGMGVICNASQNSQYNTPYAGPWHLESDVKLYHTSYQRWDVGDLTQNGRFFIDMQGHDIYFVKNPDSSSGSWWTLSIGTRILNPGNIYADGQTMMIQGCGDFEGNSENNMVFSNRCTIYMNNRAKIPWTLKFDGGASVICQTAPSGLDYTNNNSFVGPMKINNGTVRIYTPNANKVRGTTIHGPLTGNGGIFVDNCWLQLINGDKNLTGPITISGANTTTQYCGLALWSNDAVPRACERLAFTNTQIRIMDAAMKELDLPKLEYHVSSGENTLPPGMDSGTVAGLKKSGAGTLILPAPYAITGMVEVSEGTLKIGNYGNAGLYCGRYLASSNPIYFPPLDQTIYCYQILHEYQFEFTNKVELALDAFNTTTDKLWYTPSDDPSTYVMITYAGYIWNRSGETQRWSFAGAAGIHTTLRLDGEELYWFTQYNEGQKATVDVTPGPHKFYITTYDGPTHASTKAAAKGSAFANMTWTINGTSAGVMYDPEGKDSTNAADYRYMVDPGDGSLFTQSTNETTAIINMPSIHALKLGPDGTFDTYGNTFSVNTLVGIEGTITNSNPYAVAPTVFVTNSWRISTSDIAARKRLRAHVPVSFADGAKIDLNFTGRIKNGDYMVLEADAPIAGTPAVVGTKYARRLMVSKSSDGRALVLTCRNGFVIDFR